MSEVIELTGVVDAYGDCPEGHEGWEATTIADRCVACLLDEAGGEVVLVLAHGGDESLYRGQAYADHGMRGYSELTPGEAPTIMVGGADLRERLYELHGRVVHLRLEFEHQPQL